MHGLLERNRKEHPCNIVIHKRAQLHNLDLELVHHPIHQDRPISFKEFKQVFLYFHLFLGFFMSFYAKLSMNATQDSNLFCLVLEFQQFTKLFPSSFV